MFLVSGYAAACLVSSCAADEEEVGDAHGSG